MELQEFSLNNNDIKILQIVKSNQDIGIMKLQSLIGLAYKNFKSHLDKLEKYKALKIKRGNRGEKAIVNLTPLALEIIKLAISISK